MTPKKVKSKPSKKCKRVPSAKGEPLTKRERNPPATSKLVDEIAASVRREVRERLGPKSTFEQRRDMAFEIMRGALWKDTDDDLRESITDAEEVEVDGKRFARMSQPSSATYFGRWGQHHVDEPLYREVGVHNGPTIKPVELRAGIIEHMTPDMARVAGALSAERGSRSLERTLRTVGLAPPSRAFLANRVTQMGIEIAGVAAELEAASRGAEAVPSEVASVSCGLDRMSVRMSEAVEGECSSSSRSRAEPYERTPPPPQEYHYRKAWVGSASVFDAKGNELHTWRVAAEADADPAKLADRVAADVAWIAQAHPGVPVHCIQDAAPELRAMVEALERALPADMEAVVLVDFEHLMGYLDEVVDACDPEDEHDMKGWYRSELLEDDRAIERICANLRAKAKRLPGRNTKPRRAIAAALRYIRKRKDKMRYASHYQENLPIGSGATESTCWQMQQRVKLPGQSWQPDGLRGTLSIRGLVLSDRWDTAWPHYASRHRMEVSIAA